MVTFVPGLKWVGTVGGGHTASATYCYSVWLKHLTLLRQNGLEAVPDSVAELGPGGSIGVGLAALLSGAHHYVALDVLPHTTMERNVAVFDELVELFRNRTPRPDKGWPDFDAHLDDKLFPSHILTPALLEEMLAPERLARLRHAITHLGRSDGAADSIDYVAPWSDASVIAESSVDLIVSHSVLEHVTDVENTYRALHRWLKPQGWMSHQIDFKSHGLSPEWNGYRRYSEFLWKLQVGRRPFSINREPCSVHLNYLREMGFEPTLVLKHLRSDGIKRSQLTSHWAGLSDEDLNCSGLFVQARKAA
jgi:SAM-dependent methyltransferase